MLRLNMAIPPSSNPSLLSSFITPGNDRYQPSFPYLGTPHDGYDTPSS